MAPWVGWPEAAAILGLAAALLSFGLPWYGLDAEAPSALDRFDFHLSWGVAGPAGDPPPQAADFRETYGVGFAGDVVVPPPPDGPAGAMLLALALAALVPASAVAALAGGWSRRLPSGWAPAVAGMGGADAISASAAFMVGMPPTWASIRTATVFSPTGPGPWASFSGAHSFVFAGLQTGTLEMHWGPQVGWFLFLLAGTLLLACALLLVVRPTHAAGRAPAEEGPASAP